MGTGKIHSIGVGREKMKRLVISQYMTDRGVKKYQEMLYSSESYTYEQFVDTIFRTMWAAMAGKKRAEFHFGDVSRMPFGNKKE